MPIETPTSRFLQLSGALFLLALVLRMFYMFDVKVENPIRGDINDYVLYAWNLNESSTFSSEVPNSGPVAPDSYRAPGYPLMLAGAMAISGQSRLELRDAGHGRLSLVADPPNWIALTYVTQSILGSLTVLLTIFVARFWLGRVASLAGGLIVALWPHLIVFSSTLLSETLFAAALLAAIALLCHADRTGKVLAIIGAGLLFGGAQMVNPIVAALSIFLCVMLVLRNNLRFALVFFLSFAIAPSMWAVRNTTLDVNQKGAFFRAEQNFVQGSWPQFLDALTSRFDNPISAQIVDAEAAEEKVFIDNPGKGVRSVAERMWLDPSYYARWYLVTKPLLLWDWGIRVGWGDIYFLETTHSPFKSVPVLWAIERIYIFANSPLFFCALLTVIGLIAALIVKRPRSEFALTVVALTFVYVTIVHSVLQAEPRYSIPYRPLEVMLSLTSAIWIANRVREYLAATRLAVHDKSE